MNARDLLDTDGENRAVRSFLLQWGVPSLTVGAMRKHMDRSGWPLQYCPDFARTGACDGEHLTKAGAQIWIRHLFSMEALAATAPESAPADALPTSVMAGDVQGTRNFEDAVNEILRPHLAGYLRPGLSYRIARLFHDRARQESPAPSQSADYEVALAQMEDDIEALGIENANLRAELERQSADHVLDALRETLQIAEHYYFEHCGKDAAQQDWHIKAEAAILGLTSKQEAALQALTDQAQELGMDYGAPSIDSAAGWISVDERLPDDAAFVAIFDPENTEMPVRTAQWLAGSCTFESECGWLARDEVSHWQPLPAPPKEPA